MIVLKLSKHVRLLSEREKFILFFYFTLSLGNYMVRQVYFFQEKIICPSKASHDIFVLILRLNSCITYFIICVIIWPSAAQPWVWDQVFLPVRTSHRRELKSKRMTLHLWFIVRTSQGTIVDKEHDIKHFHYLLALCNPQALPKVGDSSTKIPFSFWETEEIVLCSRLILAQLKKTLITWPQITSVNSQDTEFLLAIAY